MTTIETGNSLRRVFRDAEDTMTGLSNVRVDSDRGGLVLMGPSAGELPGIDELLAMPGVGAVEAIGARMMRWKHVSAEVIEVGRAASRLIRDGRTAVVHLDSHIGEAPAVPADRRQFVCARLGQILIGLADTPAYVVTHGECMGRSLVFDSLEDCGVQSIGAIGAGYPVWQLSAATMFPGLCVAMCPGDRPVGPVADVLGWFEARRD